MQVHSSNPSLSLLRVLNVLDSGLGTLSSSGASGYPDSRLLRSQAVLRSGAGPIGLVSLLAAHAAGATPIVLTDIAQSRLDFAKTLVPTVKTVLVERSDSPKDLATKIKAAVGLPNGLSVALECTGVESSIQAAIFVSSCAPPLLLCARADQTARFFTQSVKFGSTVFVIGVGKDYQSLPFMHMSANEIDLKLQVGPFAPRTLVFRH